MKFLIFFTSILFSIGATAQNTTQNSTEIWEKSYAFRGGIGVHKSLFAEAGISKFYFLKEGYFPITKSYYASVEFSPTAQPKNENHIYALKVGAEISVLFITLGLEMKYQTDFIKNDFLITPRAGLGYCGVFTFNYGFAISTNGKPFSRIGLHQITIICNLNRKIKNEL